jgi:hypothetical protein
MTVIEKRCNEGIVKTLILHGADVNCQDSNVDTPLHKATLAAMKSLTETGARCDIVIIQGQRALHTQSRAPNTCCWTTTLPLTTHNTDHCGCNALWACIDRAAIAAHKNPEPCYYKPSCEVFDLLMQAGADAHIVAYEDGWNSSPRNSHNLAYLSCVNSLGIRLQELVSMGVDVIFATPPLAYSGAVKQPCTFVHGAAFMAR